MSADIFEPLMRANLRRRPFQNFIVELEDGQRLVIDDPQAAGFDGGSAGYVDPEGEIHFFSYEEVRNIRLEKLEQGGPHDSRGISKCMASFHAPISIQDIRHRVSEYQTSGGGLHSSGIDRSPEPARSVPSLREPGGQPVA